VPKKSFAFTKPELKSPVIQVLVTSLSRTVESQGSTELC